MASEDTSVGFRIWASDDRVYGPVELPELVSWIKDERVLADTWVFSHKDDAWAKAAETPELSLFFNRKSRGPVSVSADAPLPPAALRRRHRQYRRALAQDHAQGFRQAQSQRAGTGCADSDWHWQDAHRAHPRRQSSPEGISRLGPRRALTTRRYSRKFWNCSATGNSLACTAPITACNSSRLLPVTRIC